MVYLDTEATIERNPQQYADKTSEKILLTVISSLSMFGSVVIIVTYFLFKELQTTSRSFLVFISVGDFFTVYPTLVFTWCIQTNNLNDFNCRFQSFVTTTAVMWSFLWTSSLAIYLYFVIVKNRLEIAGKLIIFFHIINWAVPAILVGAAWRLHALGSNDSYTSGGWCWIRELHSHYKEVLWMLACGKFFEITSYFVNGILFFIVTRRIREEVKARHQAFSSESTEVALQGKRKLVFAPLLFVLLRIWGTIRFFIFVFKPYINEEDFFYKALLLLHIIGDSSQGFVNFILFCVLTVKFRENISRMCGFRKKSNEGDRIDSLIPKTGRDASSGHSYIFKGHGPITFYT